MRRQRLDPRILKLAPSFMASFMTSLVQVGTGSSATSHPKSIIYKDIDKASTAIFSFQLIFGKKSQAPTNLKQHMRTQGEAAWGRRKVFQTGHQPFRVPLTVRTELVL